MILFVLVMRKMAFDISIYASQALLVCIINHMMLIYFGVNSCNALNYCFEIPIRTPIQMVGHLTLWSLYIQC